ncbi:MAG: M20/M25/M40 family metallo-hydrolase [Chloroflexi bacterium]|nr:M20/M25/M40 family metallo-hydrolase [Chloroflexota bacterium]
MEFDDQTMQADATLSGALMQGDGGLSFLATLVDECHGRFAGTEDEYKARDLIAHTMQSYGLSEVHTEAFDYPGWSRGPQPHLVLQEPHQVLYAFSLPGSPSSHIDGDLVDFGCASDADVARVGDQLEGKIVLISASTPRRSRAMHRDEKVARAARRGAVGVLWVRDNPGQLVETGALFFHDVPRIPGVAITPEDGLRLARWLVQGRVLHLSLSTNDSPQEKTSWNVVAEIPGTERPDEFVIIGAHYDGHDLAEGATDNGSGTAAILEAARCLAKVQGSLKRTVRVVSFGVEELGLFGAYAYAGHHHDELDRCRFVFNLDSVGHPSLTKGIMTQLRPELRGPLQAIGAKMGDLFPIDDHVSMYSDHFPFVLQGVPAGSMTSDDSRGNSRGVGHTAADTFDKVHPVSLKLSAIMAARVAFFIANAAEWPAARWTATETAARLEGAGVKDTMVMEGVWLFSQS